MSILLNMSERSLLIIAGIGLFILFFVMFPILSKQLSEDIKANNEDKKSKENLKEDLLEKLATRYKEIDLMKDAKTELDNPRFDYQQDILEFLAYNEGINSIYQFPRYDENFVEEEDIYAFSVKQDKSRFIFFSGEHNLPPKGYGGGITQYFETYPILGIVFETKYINKRLYIGTLKYLKSFQEVNSKFIYNYIKKAQIFDQKNLCEWSKKIINKYNEKEYNYDGNYEVLELSEIQKQLLDKIYENNKNIYFEFTIENGVARLLVNLRYTEIKEEEVDKYCNDILFIIDSILDEFSK